MAEPPFNMRIYVLSHLFCTAADCRGMHMGVLFALYCIRECAVPLWVGRGGGRRRHDDETSCEPRIGVPGDRLVQLTKFEIV